MVPQVRFDLNFYTYGSTNSIANYEWYRKRVVVSSCRLNDNKRLKERTWSCTEKCRATRINKTLKQNDSCKLNGHMNIVNVFIAKQRVHSIPLWWFKPISLNRIFFKTIVLPYHSSLSFRIIETFHRQHMIDARVQADFIHDRNPSINGAEIYNNCSKSDKR